MSFYEYKKNKIHTQIEELKIDRKLQNDKLKKLEDKQKKHTNIQKYMFDLLTAKFSLPEDVNYDIDIDFLLDNMDNHIHEMTIDQKRTYTIIKNSNKQLNDIQKLLNTKPSIVMNIRVIDEQLYQLEKDEILLETREQLPDNFPDDILKHVMSKLITPNKRGLTKKRKRKRIKRMNGNRSKKK